MLLDELRISRTARYLGNFSPAARYDSDSDTEALFHFDEGSGEVAHDVSAHGRHAALESPLWVKPDGSEIVLLSPTLPSNAPAFFQAPETLPPGVVPATVAEQVALAERVVQLGGSVILQGEGVPRETSFKTRAEIVGLPRPSIVSLKLLRSEEPLPKAEIAVLQRLPHLRTLDLGNNVWVNDAVVRPICRIQTLRAVRIGGTSATRAVVAELKALPELSELYASDLGFQADDILALSACPKLGSLQLDNTPLPAQGIAHFAKFVNLGYLYMRYEPIDEAGLKALEALQDLRHLNISGSGITAERVVTLQAALPRCKLEWNPGAEPKP
jgi:hypothetical protein